MIATNSRPKVTRLGSRFALILALPLLLVGSSPSAAYELNDLPWPCGVAKWANDATLGFLEVSFPDPFVRAAVSEPGDRISAVGGLWFDFSGWPVHADNQNKYFRSEIWKSANLGPEVEALTTIHTSFCKIRQADIRFLAGGNAHGEPGFYGENYWDSRLPPQSERYLRPNAMKELLFAAGLDPEDNAFAFTTSSMSRTWANRGPGLKIEPLPDDRHGLRALYGAAGTELDVAVFNSHLFAIEGLLALDWPNCVPTTGTGFGDGWNLGLWCGTSISAVVCPGDRLYTSYTIANYGTQSAETTQRLYFSADSSLSGGDFLSPDNWNRTVSKDFLEHHSFEVPGGIPPGYYWPIIKISTNLNESGESTQNNWIPLRGQVLVPSNCGGPAP